MKRPKGRVSLSLLVSIALLLPALAFAQDAEQPQTEQAKKKPRRVWTNDDFASGNRPAAQQEAAPGPDQPQRTVRELFAELDQARSELAVQENELALGLKQYEGQYQRWREADNDYDRDAYRISMEVAERRLGELEQVVEDLKARIAELEALTAGMKRPAGMAKPAQKPAAAPAAAETPETAPPAGEPEPQTEPPPEP